MTKAIVEGARMHVSPQYTKPLPGSAVGFLVLVGVGLGSAIGFCAAWGVSVVARVLAIPGLIVVFLIELAR